MHLGGILHLDLGKGAVHGAAVHLDLSFQELGNRRTAAQLEHVLVFAHPPITVVLGGVFGPLSRLDLGWRGHRRVSARDVTAQIAAAAERERASQSHACR